MKILILHASAGAGHKRAAEALGKVFRLRAGRCEVEVRDILDFTPAVFRRGYARGYLRIVRSAPELWGYLYERSDRQATEPWRRTVRAAFNKINATSFFQFYEDLCPDLTVCTHYLPLELLSTKARRRRLTTPFYCCVTDFAVHSLWILENVDCYYVATEEARRHLIRRGQSPDHVQVTGIPLDPVFLRAQTPAAARRSLGVREELPTVLILSGGFGVGPAVDLIRSFRVASFECQLLVVAGANEALRKEAATAAREIRLPTRVFGFVSNIDELMDAADLVVTKPGGLTSSEVLAKRKPMLIVDPIPGQEQRNCEYLLEVGVAERLLDVEDAPSKVERLLKDRNRMAQLKRNAQAVGKPRAAFEIVDDVMGRMARRTALPAMTRRS